MTGLRLVLGALGAVLLCTPGAARYYREIGVGIPAQLAPVEN